MSVEQGLYILIQSGTSNLAPGFAVMLPENQLTASAPMAWSYRSITSTPTYTLGGQGSFYTWTVQLDAHGTTMKYAIQLSDAIIGALRGSWSGVMEDSDSTKVAGIFQKSTYTDGFKDENKSFVRSTDWCVQYYQA
jgi:hypothetical protein